MLRIRLLMSLLCAALALPVAATASNTALPEAVRTLAPDWRQLGSGEMSWFGLRLYDAQLWGSAASFSPASPYALHLTYARDFSAERLADTSIDEMRRLGTRDEATLARWRAELGRVFPEVKRGDVIVGVHLPDRGARFYHQGKLTGEVNDPAFARAFFAIWLDPRTRAPELRTRLLGSAS
ncbi:chalcone isomerase family protein [Niveibacterium sp. 24ML]|uniref:chalcone isomerase family protein n=1 Tax=Niveibacterium sp. 24ML TaxID=2985512 RepID=UPI00226EC504|nr:chalcone isomerase family protein [Niveibacterium sp. 24ML]MCX9154908.1 chalcone isomerase family protein [Niveibacterium sp. 24ML]